MYTSQIASEFLQVLIEETVLEEVSQSDMR